METTIAVVPWDDDDVARLRGEQQAELAEMYDGEADLEPELPPEEMLATVAVSVGGEVVACGSLRDAARYGDGYGELKRMYVLPRLRGRGLARQVLVALERIAEERGLRRLILETGVRQLAAIRLYRSAGYRRIPAFGPYDERDLSVCYAKWLVDGGARVLVLAGSGGRESTYTDALAEAAARLLPARGAPNLQVVSARAPEDAVDLEAFELAFDGAEVRIVPVPDDDRSLLEVAAGVLVAAGR